MATLYYRDPADGQYKPIAGTGNDHGNLFGLADNDHPQYQTRAEKGVANGYASLDANADVPYALLPIGTAAFTVAAGDHNHAALGYRPITLSAAAPSGGADGDVWMTYV